MLESTTLNVGFILLAALGYTTGVPFIGKLPKVDKPAPFISKRPGVADPVRFTANHQPGGYRNPFTAKHPSVGNPGSYIAKRPSGRIPAPFIPKRPTVSNQDDVSAKRPIVGNPAPFIVKHPTKGSPFVAKQPVVGSPAPFIAKRPNVAPLFTDRRPAGCISAPSMVQGPAGRIPAPTYEYPWIVGIETDYLSKDLQRKANTFCSGSLIDVFGTILTAAHCFGSTVEVNETVWGGLTKALYYLTSARVCWGSGDPTCEYVKDIKERVKFHGGSYQVHRNEEAM